jgi:DNA-binding NarL/FixJ family response regulator
MTPPLSHPLTVLIDHAEPLLATGALHALAGLPGIEGRWVDPDTPEPRADVVITDYRTGLRRAAEAANAPPRRPRVVVVTAHDREHEVRQALQAGVHGYLLTSCTTAELVQCVRAVGSGSRHLCVPVARRMAESLTREPLTAREVDVLRLLVRGQGNKTIAQHLDIAVGTVKAHVKSIMGKLDACSRTHAVSVAASRGLIEEPQVHEASDPRSHTTRTTLAAATA